MCQQAFDLFGEYLVKLRFRVSIAMHDKVVGVELWN